MDNKKELTEYLRKLQKIEEQINDGEADTELILSLIHI